MTRHEQWKFLDTYRRKLYLRHELRKSVLRSITRSSSIPLVNRYSAKFHLSIMPSSASLNKIRNRCALTGRARNILKRVRYSRFVLRDRASRSFLPGARRSSW